MSSLLFDFAVQFDEVTGTTKPSLNWLHKIAVVVAPNYKPSGPVKSSSPEEGKVLQPGQKKPLIALESNVVSSLKAVEVYSPETAKTYTDNPDIHYLFEGGAQTVILVMDAAVADPSLSGFDISQTNTILGSQDFTPDEVQAMDFGDFKGVFGFSSDDKDAAKTLAATGNTACAFDPLGSYSGLYQAFGRLVSRTYWRDCQYYRPSNDSSIGKITDLGEANDLFASGVTFYLNDENEGTRLASFFAGHKPVTNDYIRAEIKQVEQAYVVNFLALNEPRNTSAERILIEDGMQDIIDQYEQTPFSYLNPDYDNKVTLVPSPEAYVVNGDMDTQVTDPIWKLKIEARQG